MGVEVAAVFITIAKVIGPSIASSLMAKALEKTAGKLWGLKKKELEKKIEKASEDAFLDFVRAFPKGKAIGDSKILERFFDSVTLKEELEKVVLTDHQTPNLHTLYQAFLEAGYTEDMLPGFDFDDAMNAFIGKFREELEDVIQHRVNEEEGILKLYRDQVIEHCGRLDFVGIPELRDERGLKVDDIFVTLRARERVPEADVLLEGEAEAKDVEDLNPRRRIRRDDRTRDITPIRLYDALKRNRMLVVLGSPGAGKTTMLRYVALKLAQNEQGVSVKELGLSRDLVPVFMELRRFADRDDQRQSLVESMYDYMKTCLSVPLPPNFFEGLLDQGKCVVLLDGLDDVATLAQRVEVKNTISLFASRYKGNTFIVTSRIAGYSEAGLGGNFKHFTLCGFTDEDIERFAEKWYNAREGDTEAAQGKADDLVKAIKDNPRVLALARNPLMLTIVALIHKIEAKLPNQRIKLYDKCTESLLYTWEAVKRRGEESASEEEKRSRCEKIAYWMQDMPGTGERERTVRRGELQEKLARILREEGIINMREARAEAKHFLDQIRRRTGVLIEQGRDLYSFAHLTFQEYFAACEVYKRLMDALFTPDGVDSFWNEEIKHRLHDTRWQEAILLFMGKVSAVSSKGASDLVRRILEADSPYDHILHRDLLLAGRCLADDVEADDPFEEQILRSLFDLFRSGQYTGLRNRARNVLTAMSGSKYKDVVIQSLTEALSHKDNYVRSNAAEALGNLGTASKNVIDALIETLGDESIYVRSNAAEALGNLGTASKNVIDALVKTLGDGHWHVRSTATEALSQLGTESKEVVNALIGVLGDQNWRIRSSAALALGKLGAGSGDVADDLLKALDDNHWSVRYRAASALGQLRIVPSDVIEALTKALDDEDNDVRSSVAEALGNLGTASEDVARTLIKASGDEYWVTRSGAALALGKLGNASEDVKKALVKALGDEYNFVRSSAAEALGKLGVASNDVIDALVKTLRDKYSDVRSSAAEALGKLGRSPNEDVIHTLTEVLRDDKNLYVRSSAAEALGKLGTASEQVMQALIGALGVGYGYVRSSAASALGRLGTASGEALTALIKALEDDEGNVRSSAAEALGKLAGGSREAMKALLERLEVEKDSDAADAMFEAVYSLAGQERGEER